ncbi:MAG: hypothetical protein ACO25B_05870 [Chitinophagaceae bacterium]
MLSEEFDKKIREAADHHHPAYDEKAWSGMKKLLDRHMPEEKDDRRRYFFFLLFFLLLSGAAWFFLGRQGSPSGKKTVAETSTVPLANANTAGNDTKGTKNGTIPGNTAPENPSDGPGTGNDIPEDNYTPGIKSPDNDLKAGTRPDGKETGIASNTTSRNKSAGPLETPVSRQTEGKNKPASNNLSKAPGLEENKDNLVKKENTTQPVSKTEAVAPADQGTAKAGHLTQDPTAPVASDPLPVAAKEPVSDLKPENKKTARQTKKISQRKSSFFFSVSGGPDVSYTGNDELGKMQFVGGAGIGYTYRDRFTLRSGFYSARKIYTSSPGEYKAPPFFYTYYPNLQYIEADCKVYEIPLLLSYHFGRNGNRRWSATAGISTILMKRETYDYYYKYQPNSPVVHREYTLYDENKHLFSMLTFSGGFHQPIGKRVYISAEPYFKMPLSGLGFGKVNLNSAGVLFSLSVRPFGKNPSKSPGK